MSVVISVVSAVGGWGLDGKCNLEIDARKSVKLVWDLDKGILGYLNPKCYMHESIHFSTGRWGEKYLPFKVTNSTEKYLLTKSKRYLKFHSNISCILGVFFLPSVRGGGT